MRFEAPGREQWLAICFLSLLGYVQAFAEGTPCTTYHHLWLGTAITYAIIALCVWVVADMVLGWILTAVYLVRRRQHPSNQG